MFHSVYDGSTDGRTDGQTDRQERVFSQGVVSGDGQVEARLAERGRGAVHRLTESRPQYTGIVQLDDV